MEVTGSLQIVCPIRGQLKVNKRSKDGLSASEEFIGLRQLSICYPGVILKRISGLSQYALSANIVQGQAKI